MNGADTGSDTKDGIVRVLGNSREYTFSNEIRETIDERWKEWNGKDAMAKALSSTTPGFFARSFETWDEAFDFATTNRVDVAFLDVELFGESGIDLAGKLSEINPNINHIFLTGHSEYTFDALQMHCSGYLMKPLTPEKLLKEMEHLRFPIQGLKR